METTSPNRRDVTIWVILNILPFNTDSLLDGDGQLDDNNLYFHVVDGNNLHLRLVDVDGLHIHLVDYNGLHIDLLNDNINNSCHFLVMPLVHGNKEKIIRK